MYEDADEEELTRQEVVKYLWRSSVPESKVEQCRRHANHSNSLSHEPGSSSDRIGTNIILLQPDSFIGSELIVVETSQSSAVSSSSNGHTDLVTSSTHVLSSSSSGSDESEVSNPLYAPSPTDIRPYFSLLFCDISRRSTTILSFTLAPLL